MLSNPIRLVTVLVGLVVFLAPNAEARNRKSEKLYKWGQEAEAQKDYDKALDYYEQALAIDPKEPAYQLVDNRVRFKASEAHIAAGRKLQQDQKLDAALVEFQKAFVAQPSSSIAIQEIRNTMAMIKEREKAPAGTVILTPAQKARQETEKRLASLEAPPVLQPMNNIITGVKINAQSSRVLYETLGKVAGVNVLFDPVGFEGAGKNFNLDLGTVTLEDALNYVALQTHTYWKPISKNAIFVTQDTDQKRQEYQEDVVKVFYIQNAASATEFTDIFNGIRQGSGLTRGILNVASQYAIVVRASADAVALVEKLVQELDRPKAEIIIDVIVLEVNKSKTQTLAAALAGNGGAPGLNVPISFTPRFTQNSTTTTGTTTTGTTTTGTTTGSTTSGSSETLAQLGHISSADFSTNVPGALVEALLSDSTSRVMQRPQLRATDGGKATLKIGSKIPYVSGSLNSAVATPGSIPYATTQFQQIDVGTNIDFSPHVNGSDEISMKVKVEITAETTTVSIGGISQPVISQRVNEADIRLKDGEMSVLGGLSSDTTTKTLAGIPGLVNIPLLGYLFGSKQNDKQSDDILVALVPHIVRAPDLNPNEKAIATGTERNIRVLRSTDAIAPLPATSVPVPSAPAPAAPPAIPPVVVTPAAKPR